MDKPREIMSLEDDGCPHGDEPRAGTTFHLFVPFRPAILRAMIGTTFDVLIEPYNMGGTHGSIVSTMCDKDFTKLHLRFYPNPKGPDDEEEGDPAPRNISPHRYGYYPGRGSAPPAGTDGY